MSRKVWRYMAAFPLILGATALMAVLTLSGAQPPRALAWAVGTGSQSPAATIVVDSLADTTGTCSTTGTSPCTLRDAITYANAIGGANTITFSVSGIITLTATLPAIDDDVTIDGSGQTITVSGNHAVGVMIVNSGKQVTLKALTIANGQCNFCGGGIDNSGTLTVTNSAFSGNSASGGGSIRNNGGTLTVVNSTFTGNSAPSSNGGGLDNISGLLTVTGSTFSGNSAPGGIGGGIGTSGGTLIVTNSTFSGNSALIGGGGGIGNSGGALSVTNSTFSGNSASGGGGIDSFGGGATLRNTLVANSPSGGDCGGSVTADSHNLADDATCGSATHATSAQINLGPLANNGGSTLTMALNPTSVAINAGDNAVCPLTDQRDVARPQGLRCDVGAYEFVYTPTQTGPAFVVNHLTDTDDGSCDALGSGIVNQDCTLRDALDVANARGGANTITFNVSGTITLSLTLPAINADVTMDGSGHTITVSGASLYRVLTINGGKHVTVNALTIANGTCNNCFGGGIYNSGMLTVTNTTFTGNSATLSNGIGGGIYNQGTLNVSNSTFSGNSAPFGSGNGGGIYNQGTLNVSNSTFSGNSAPSGGGIYNQGTLTVTNSTFSGNSAGGSNGGGGIYGSGALGSLTTLRNTIIANSASGGDCDGIGIGILIADSHNLADDNSCGSATQKTSAQINLGPLANNGGATQTFALKYPSAAIDAGDDAVCPATDQRGVARPIGRHCDVGAYEAAIRSTVYLPLIANNFANVPDLFVSNLIASSHAITVVIQNVGPALVVNPFRVDFYVNPVPAPVAVNQIWNDGRSSQGAVWMITASALPSLAPGGTLTLTLSSAYYRADLSHLTGIAPGTNVYAQVDSSGPAPYGAVVETHEVLGEEYNNIRGPVVSSSGAAGPALLIRSSSQSQ